ncbi:MAG: PrgI family protein [Candidatus Portnoybacteria bacterium]|nr:PrgI family protein [Candidatus Portnoybacteria bacterium]
MQFNVPQFLEVEDKIVGPLTLKQFGYLGGTGAILFFLYQYAEFWLFMLASIPLTLFALALAFLKINGRPFITILGASINYIIKGRMFIWKKNRI